MRQTFRRIWCGKAARCIAVSLAVAVLCSPGMAEQTEPQKLVPIRGVPFPSPTPSLQVQATPVPQVQPAFVQQPPLTQQAPALPTVAAGTPVPSETAGSLQPPAATPQSATLLPQDLAARQAAALAASVVPPARASADITTLAGEYSYGNGFNINCTLEISTDGRFLYKRCDCEDVVDQSTGRIKLDDQGNVVLEPVQPRASWPRGTAPVLIPVSWGQRLYLVPQDDVLGFVNQVNRGQEPVSRGSMGSYYLREGDWDRPTTGLPTLPEEWKSRILEDAVEGVVAGKDPSGRWIINRGKEHGIYDQMELTAWSPGGRRFLNLRVTETGTETSAVEVLSAPPNVSVQGWTVSSRMTPPGAAPAESASTE